jgi:hypothetical protein
MLDLHDLIALLEAYCRGDTLARKVLIDALEEAGDPRIDAVRAEAIDWDELARRLAPSPGGHVWYMGLPRDVSYFRWLIDCARYGSPTRPDVALAVRRARRDWLQGLFPEVRLAE